MGEISRAALFGKLNSVAYKAIEAATVFCKLRGNPYVELAHWFHQLLQLQDSDLHRIIRQFNVEPARLARDLTEALDRLPRGSTSITDLSSHVEEAVERGWVYGSLMFGESQVRTGYLVLGILKTPSLRHALLGLSSEFDKIKAEALSERFDEYVGDSPENALSASDGFNAGAVPGEASGAMAPSAMGKQEALKRFTVDLTEQARSGKLDPIVGRDEEIRQLVDILMRRRQNNPILTGEAGVGKTAVVEGLALRIAEGSVPEVLAGCEIHTLDMGLLQAGASVKGEFENRLKNVIDEVKKSPHAIILFIDEAHTMIGAGGTAGQNDAANLLKPALARGELRTIAATTWGEYKKYFEKDAALARRFQVVKIEEPSEELACAMLRGMAPLMEKHFNVRVYDEAITEAVRLSHRYISGRQLPDKAISVLDTACAKVALGQNATPALIENLARKLERMAVESASLSREQATGGAAHTARLKELEAARKAASEEHAALAARWEKEKDLTERIKAARVVLDSGEAADKSLVKDVEALQVELRALQVDGHVGAEIVAGWAGIPLGKMVKDEIKTVLNLKDLLEQRVLGQSHA